jgi:hypothetical protein
MSKFTFTNPVNGQVIEVDGPPALTEAQAQQIFKQQLDAGSLVGLKPGNEINAVSQLAGGLLSAAAQTTQALLPQTSTLFNQGTQLATNAATAAAAGVNDAIKNIVPSNPINVADLAKQASSLMPMQGLSQLDVRAAMSQASKLVGQASTIVSNELGAGKFGFDAQQLERAGVLKPGTFSTYLAAGTANLTSVLNSPAVWTGVNGVTNVDKLLSSVPTQNLIQQDLMSQGLAGVKDLGVSLDKLGESAKAGLALNASKSIADAASWAKDLPLPAEVKNTFDKIARDGAFAVDLSNTTANDAVRQEEPANPAIDTADRQTINAAVTRVTGNDKIPPVDFQSIPATEIVATALLTLNINVESLAKNRYAELNARTVDLVPLSERARATTNVSNIASLIQSWEDLLADYSALSGEILALQRQSQALEARTGKTMAGAANLENIASKIPAAVEIVKKQLQLLKDRIEAIAAQQ